jgi:hypothetical protein
LAGPINNPTDADDTGAVSTASPAPNPTPSPAPTPAVESSGTIPLDYQGSPTPAAPVKRGGLAGILDDFRDAIAGGGTAPQLNQAEDGTKYVTNVPLTGAQKWARIAAEAGHGAAAGLAAGKGAGNMGRGALAGFEVGEHDIGERQQQRQEMNAEARQSMLDKYNIVKLQHDIAAGEFALTRGKTRAQEEDIQFAQGQADREKQLGSADLGTYKNAYSLADVQKQNPTFWKDAYSGRVIAVPEIGANGERQGVHLFLRTEGINTQPAPQGTKVWRYVPGEKPGDQPKLVAEELNQPATIAQVDAYNAAAYKQYQSYTTDKQKLADDEATRLLHGAQTKEAEAGVIEKHAQAAKANAEARKARIEAAALSGTNEGGGDINSQAQALVEGRTAASLLSKRSKDYNAIMATADRLSMQQTGHKYDQQEGEIRYDAYKKLVMSYTGDGDHAKTLESFDKFLAHSVDASMAVNSMRNTDVKLVNTPWNKLRDLSGSKSSPALTAGLAKLETVRKEYESFLENNHALTDEDKKAGQKILDDNGTPAQMQAALKSMAGISVDRLRSADYTFLRTTHQHVPDLISGDGATALRHFGFNPDSVYAKLNNQQPAPQVDANGMVSVQLPGHPPGKIPVANLPQFLQQPGAAVVKGGQ